MDNLFSVGDEEVLALRIKRLMAVRLWRRHKTVGDVSLEKAKTALKATGLTTRKAEDVYYLTSLAKFDDRFVIPPAHREHAIEMLEFTGDTKGSTGFGIRSRAERGM